ncbi:MAG: hypothetical protein II168_07985, partial [Ruminococcus sp.]|nr:hypothetical protein [Ruminococcus sp.]
FRIAISISGGKPSAVFDLKTAVLSLETKVLISSTVGEGFFKTLLLKENKNEISQKTFKILQIPYLTPWLKPSFSTICDLFQSCFTTISDLSAKKI